MSSLSTHFRHAALSKRGLTAETADAAKDSSERIFHRLEQNGDFTACIPISKGRCLEAKGEGRVFGEKRSSTASQILRRNFHQIIVELFQNRRWDYEIGRNGGNCFSTGPGECHQSRIQHTQADTNDFAMRLWGSIHLGFPRFMGRKLRQRISTSNGNCPANQEAAGTPK